MRLGKRLKRDTIIITFSVLILTLTTIRVSYAAFFEVKSNSNVQTMSTGELKVYIDKTQNKSSSITLTEVFPTPTINLPQPGDDNATLENHRQSYEEGSYAKIVLANDGNYNAEFVMSIGYDSIPADKKEEDLIDLRHLNIGIYDSEHGWNNFGTAQSPQYYISIASLAESEFTPNMHPVIEGILNTGENVTYQIYIWLDENTPIDEIGSLVYLKLDVDSRVLNDGHDLESGE